MANVKLKSIFTKEDIYTVLQLLKALADGVDENDADMQSQIDELKKKIDTLKPEPEGYAVDGSGNVTINDVLHVAKNGKVEVGKDLEVDGNASFAGKEFGIYTGTLAEATEKRLGYYAGENTLWMFTIDSDTKTYFAGINIDDSGVYSATIASDEEDVTFRQLVTDEFVTNQVNALSDEIEAAFSKAKYQHTVTITGSRPVSGGGACIITFTAYSSKNTPIDSYQDLNAVLGGCDVSASGLYSPASGTNRGVVKLDLHGGAISSDKVYYSDPSLNGLQSIALSSCGNLTFTDDVCVPK